MKTKCSVITLLLDNRLEDAPEVQKVLTTHGCLFKVRLGVPRGYVCSNEGLIILVAEGSEESVASFLSDLEQFPQVKVYHVDIC